MKRSVCTRASVGLASLAAVGFGSFATGVVGHAATPPNYTCQGRPNGTVLLVDHVTGGVATYTSTATTSAIQLAINDAKGSSDNATPTPTGGPVTGSGAGDTVIACPGVYVGDIVIPAAAASTSSGGPQNTTADKDNITVRTDQGPNNTTIQGKGDGPVVSILARGVTFGGPALGFTVTSAAPTAAQITGVEVGIPGAQSTANEDEACAAAAGATVFPGCDENTPAAVTVNDQVIGNVFQNFVPGHQDTAKTKPYSTLSVSGIETDNTINTTIQQNLFRNLVGEGTTVGSIQGIVIGTLDGTAPGGTTPPAGFNSGQGNSTDINTAVFDNTITQLWDADDNGACPSTPGLTGITLNGFQLDSQVYNNLIQQLSDDACHVTGIFSDAYGSLENEQTGTLVPVNANIDNNKIQQLGQNNAGTAIQLDPTPSTANPGPAASPTGCTTTNAQQSCSDTIPPSSYTVTDNELSQVTVAVEVQALLGTNSYIRENNFDNAFVGVWNNPTAPASADTNLDATNNWWGCPQGPVVTTTYPATPPANHGCAELVSPPGTTSWAPPLASPVEQAGDNAGDNAGNN